MYIFWLIARRLTKQLWKEVKSWLGNAVNLPDLNSQNALLGFKESHLERYSILANHLLLILRNCFMMVGKETSYFHFIT